MRVRHGGSPLSQGTEEFERLALPHLGAVARFALSLTRDQIDADDLVQDTFLRARQSWHTFDRVGDARKWLFAICRNYFLSGLRRSRRVVQSDDGDLDALEAVKEHNVAAAAGIADLYDRMDVLPAIRRAIDELPEPHHSILVLVDLEEHSYEEAAEVLGIPRGTVRSRLFRARRLIQEALLAHAHDLGLARGASPETVDA